MIIARKALFKLLESLGENAWGLNLETHKVFTSNTFWQRLGYDPDFRRETRESALRLVHSLDAGLAAAEVGLHLSADEPFELELRVRAADGEWRFTRLRGCVTEMNSKGEASAIGGIIEDITEAVSNARARSHATDLMASLSNRERQVVECLVAGLPNKNIAYALGLSQRTVEGYRARLMDKLGVKGIVDLVQVAIAAGITGDNAICRPLPEADYLLGGR
jgi:DNA-binding CsgD family transcriptional regulator